MLKYRPVWHLSIKTTEVWLGEHYNWNFKRLFNIRSYCIFWDAWFLLWFQAILAGDFEDVKCRGPEQIDCMFSCPPGPYILCSWKPSGKSIYTDTGFTFVLVRFAMWKIAGYILTTFHVCVCLRLRMGMCVYLWTGKQQYGGSSHAVGQ